MNNTFSYEVLVVNGPNLGYIGKRDINTYGSRSIEEIPDILNENYPSMLQKTKIDFFQSNGEGRIIDRLEKAWQDKISGIVINPGAYTHTSLALADCLSWINIPYVEVHLSNVWSRDKIRQHSLTAKRSLGVVAGFGIMSYIYGLMALVDHLDYQ
ncbi:MAG: 3-dehydroquinate dehydratase [Desulfonatronovibrio sp. MSAO_Bac4]|nr:MAG: 3-dehydroquinate dehydratase [Desulfonatronovibrio sp. MSAO_Bac4]